MQFVFLDIDSTVNRITLFALLPFLVAFSFVVFIFYRRNRENLLRRKQVELELKAIRAQINPHFIFNCLNSIHFCIQNNESEKAGKYLLKFSYLTRRILENSANKWISLEEDIDILKAYLDLEQLRSGNRFTYHITINENIDASATAVPMLIIQPLVENAVWHGFNSRQEDGKLEIEVDSTDQEVIFRIRDNGTYDAANRVQNLPGKEKSMGISLVKEQMEAIRELEKRDVNLKSSNINNGDGKHIGTVSELTLPYIPFF